MADRRSSPGSRAGLDPAVPDPGSNRPGGAAPVALAEVERWLLDLYVAAEGASLRDEDRRKAVEVAAMLREVDGLFRRAARRVPFTLVDAAAGKSYVGLLAAKLVFEPSGRTARVLAIEREAARVDASARAADRLHTPVPIDCIRADVDDASAWPDASSLVVALHACGPAADAIIGRTIAASARALLLVPCCTSRLVPAVTRAEGAAERAGIPRHAPVRRRFVQAMVDAERTLRLEAAGYETEVVEWVPATVTPHNLLWRARLVRERSRMAAARRQLEVLGNALPPPPAGTPA